MVSGRIGGLEWFLCLRHRRKWGELRRGCLLTCSLTVSMWEEGQLLRILTVVVVVY